MRVLINLSAVAGALGFVPDAIAMVVAALHLHEPTSRIEPQHENSSTTPDPLGNELKWCLLIASKAGDKPACAPAPTENHSRFFIDAPTRPTQSAVSNT